MLLKWSVRHPLRAFYFYLSVWCLLSTAWATIRFCNNLSEIIGCTCYRECWTLHLQDISPTRHFAYDMNTSPTGQFAYETLRVLDSSPTTWTVRPLNVNTCCGFWWAPLFHQPPAGHTTGTAGRLHPDDGPSVIAELLVPQILLWIFYVTHV